MQHDRIAGLLAELEQEKGPVEPQVMEEVRREWPAPGERTAKRRSAFLTGDPDDLGRLSAPHPEVVIHSL